MRPAYTSLTSRSNNEWTLEDQNEDEGDESALSLAYKDAIDEDEFGLPMLSNARRKAKRIPNDKSYDPGGGGANGNLGSSLLQPAVSGRARSNSSDIAEERGAPSYPTTKKTEGKILRPQYKEILRGIYL